ncbi:MAG: capsular biosynthesis protein [Proteobacteria bacterium]|nr:capsular biosynthesis protein [Pseudomonadota bacterium]
MHLGVMLFHVMAPQAAQRRSRLASGLSLCGGFLKHAFSSIADSSHNAHCDHKADVVMLSDGISFSSIDGQWYEKFCDPIRDALSLSDVSSFLMTPQNRYYQPRHSPSMFIHPALTTILLKNMFRTSDRDIYKALPNYEEFLAFLGEKFPQMPLLDSLWLSRQIRSLEDISRYYTKILKKLNPAVAFIVSYYWTEGMAFIHACRQYGIPVIDIQHGAQGPLHKAYGRWIKIPQDGYELLPSHFYCWSEYEAETIGDWNSQSPGAHIPMIVGNRWLSFWKDSNNTAIKRYDSQLSQLKDSIPSTYHLLVTLQPEFSGPKFLEPLFKAISLMGDSFHWWFRLHPMMMDKRHLIKKLLSQQIAGRFDLDWSSDIPLPALLRQVDVHLTFCSTVITEAVFFGVPSVILDQFGVEFFPKEMESGWAVAAFSTEEITEAIKRQILVKVDPLGDMEMSGESFVDPISEVVSMIRNIRAQKELNAIDR